MPTDPLKPLVICDTNIWYGIENSTIPYGEVRRYNLIGTNIVVFELSNPKKLATDFLLMQRVIRTFYNYHASIISCNPLSHLVGLFVRNLPLKSDCHYYLKSFTEIMRIRIFDNVLPAEFISHCQRMQTDRIGWMNEITLPANEALNTIIRPGIKRSGGKQKHKLKESVNFN